ncbi:hypothetical protein DYB30_008447 [Aphanomyces astaci]|uniref:Retrovirus-related Pol polyprotein from transposon TNT 1-94-like beta-barrel domain-containing protein n=1 Tax=Aphanomyces astaci TaxID=112090 RepID=A0A397DVP4_APHAT|nr:hypothetical protein DYB30_008447 [Aphanomyces astaci]
MSPTAYERHASKAKDPQDGYPQSGLATQQDEAAANHPNLPEKSFLARQFRNLQTTLEPKAKKMVTTLTVLLAPARTQNDERIVINKVLRRLVEEKVQERRTQAKASAALARTIELELKEHEDMPDLDYRNVTSPGGNLPGKRRPTSIHEIEVSDPTKKDEMNTAVNAVSILTEGICQPDPAMGRARTCSTPANISLLAMQAFDAQSTMIMAAPNAIVHAVHGIQERLLGTQENLISELSSELSTNLAEQVGTAMSTAQTQLAVEQSQRIVAIEDALDQRVHVALQAQELATRETQDAIQAGLDRQLAHQYSALSELQGRQTALIMETNTTNAALSTFHQGQVSLEETLAQHRIDAATNASAVEARLLAQQSRLMDSLSDQLMIHQEAYQVGIDGRLDRQDRASNEIRELLRLQVEQSNALMALVRATSSTQATTQVQVQALTVSVEEQKGKPDTDLLRELRNIQEREMKERADWERTIDARLASMTQNQAAWQREMALDRATTNAKHDDRAVHADKERLIELQSLRELISQLRSSNIPSISTATKTYTTPPTVTKKLFTNLPRVDNSGDSGDDEDDNDDGRSGESSQRGDDRDNRGRERNGKPHKDASGAGGDPDEPSDDESSEADDIDAPPDSRRHRGSNPRPRNPKLKDFKIQPLFDGKEKYPGLGSDFPNWLSIFEDAIATNVAFYNTTWSDQHKFYALMQSLTDNAKAFAQDSKAKEPTQSYTIMSARLESNYSTHLTQTQLMTLMQKTKRWESTWTDHLTYLHHVHSMARVGNEFVLECLINNACPSKKNDLTIQLNPRARNDVAEQHRMVGILTRLTGTGIDFGRRHKTGGKETGQANQVYGGGGNKPGSKQRSGKGGDSTKEKNKNKQDNKPIKPCYLCNEGTHWAKECPLVALGREAKAKAGKTGRANAAKGNQMTTSETRKTTVIEPTATANFIFAESLSFPDDFDSDIVSYLVRGSHVNDAPDAGAMVIRQASTVDDWVCDSGCTHHLTNNPSLLIDAHGSNLRIRIANDDHVMATLKGLAILDLVNGGKIRLNEVHYVPSISANLLSITSLNFNVVAS